MRSDGLRSMTGNLNVNTRSIVDSDRLNHSISSHDVVNVFQYLMDNPSSEFSDEDDVRGVKVTNRDFHRVFILIMIQAKGSIAVV